MPQFECIHCKKWLRFNDRNPGDIADCPFCAGQIVVPAANLVDIEPIPNNPDPVAPALGGEPAHSTAESFSTKITATIGASAAIPSGSKNSKLEPFSFASEWFVFSNGQRSGPYSVIELRSMASIGVISPDDKLTRNEDGSAAVTGPELPFLFDCFPPIPRRLRTRLIDASFDEIGTRLVLFCVFAVVVMPLYGIYSLYTSIISQPPSGDGQPLPSFFTLESVWLVGVAIYGIAVGCIIWWRNRVGYKIARQYLAIRFAGVIALATITLPAELSRHPDQKFRVFFPVCGEAIFFAIWWCSLSYEERNRKSDRDKFRTYLRMLAGPTNPQVSDRDNSPPASLPDDSDAKGVWFVRSQGKETGPFSVEEMIAKASARSIHPDNMVKPIDGDWRAASSVSFLKKVFAKQSIKPAPGFPSPSTPQTQS